MPITGDTKRWIENFVTKFLHGTPTYIIQYDAEGYPQKVAAPMATIFKTADQSKTSDDVLAADNTLQFAMTATKNYIVNGFVHYTTGTTPDFKFSITGATATGVVILGYQVGVPALSTDAITEGGVAVAASATYIGSTALTSATETQGFIRFTCRVKTTGNGTFAFQWSQNTSDAGATIVKAGSYIEYKQVD